MGRFLISFFLLISGILIAFPVVPFQSGSHPIRTEYLESISSSIPGDWPPSVDLSASEAFPPIGDQGSLESSCVGWATTYYQLTYENALARGLNAQSGDRNLLFSPAWTYNLLNHGSNGNALFIDAYNLLAKNGAATWAAFPYDGQDFRSWCLDPAAWRQAINYRIEKKNLVPVTFSGDGDINSFLANLKMQLNQRHVAVFSTYIGSWVFSRRNGKAPLQNQYIAAYMQSSRNDLHAMTFVGYDDNLWADLNGNGLEEPAEKGAFKVANSKGLGWRSGGFAWISYDALRAVSAVPATKTWPPADRDPGSILCHRSAYSLTVQPSYTPAFVAAVALNTARRDQLSVSLGVGPAGSDKPSVTWNSIALNHSGGALAFDGSTAACNGTFFLDFTDLSGLSPANIRWYAGIADSLEDKNAATISSFQLYRGTDANPVSENTSIRTVDGQQVWIGLDYDNSPDPVPSASAANVALTNSSINPTSKIEVPPVSTVAALESVNSPLISPVSGSDSTTNNDTFRTWIIIGAPVIIAIAILISFSMSRQK